MILSIGWTIEYPALFAIFVGRCKYDPKIIGSAYPIEIIIKNKVEQMIFFKIFGKIMLNFILSLIGD